MENSKHTRGGMTTAKILKERAMADYTTNPNICLCCGQIIQPMKGQKISVVRRKKFCNKACAASFNNSRREKKKVKPKISKEKFDIARLTKGEVFQKYKSWQSARSRIRLHACLVLGDKKPCFNCSYNLHVEVCHIEPVKSFGLETLVSEINSIDNLVFLCPNCHWEFDSGFLKIRCGPENRTQLASL